MAEVAKTNGEVHPSIAKQHGGIYAKLHAVMSECNYIQRDKRNEFHGYTYASDGAIKDRVHTALVKHGVIFLPISATIISREPGIGKDVKDALALTTVRVAYKFVDIESCEQVCGEFDGSGQDALDKGLYKAITGALKYILTSTFLIPTGNDPEDEEPKKPGARPPRHTTETVNGGVKGPVAPDGRDDAGASSVGTFVKSPTPPPAGLPDDGVPLNVLKLWECLAAGRDSWNRVFAEARKNLENIFGKEVGTLKYLDTLHRHGIQSAETYKKMSVARDCIRDLYNQIIAAEPPLPDEQVVEDSRA